MTEERTLPSREQVMVLCRSLLANLSGVTDPTGYHMTGAQHKRGLSKILTRLVPGQGWCHLGRCGLHPWTHALCCRRGRRI